MYSVLNLQTSGRKILPAQKNEQDCEAPCHEGRVERSGCTAPCILNFRPECRRSSELIPRPLYLRRKCPRCILDRMLGGPKSPLDALGERGNLSPLPGI